MTDETTEGEEPVAAIVTCIDAAPENLAPFDPAPFLRGALGVRAQAAKKSDRAPWLVPSRFAPEQVRALSSCAAWHPAMFSQMAQATAGIRLVVSTDADEVFLDLDVDAEPRATTAQVELAAGGPTDEAYDGVAVFVDGSEVWCEMPAPGRTCLHVDVAEARRRASRGRAPELPGFEAPVTVEIWLPCLRGCVLGGLYHTGRTLEEVAQGPVLLCLGDSITQGFLAGDPALCWASRVARKKGYDLLNQGVGGQVFQWSSLAGLERVEPAAIWIALGTNYRFSPCRTERERPDIERYFDLVAKLWPDVKTYVATPLFSDEGAYPTHARSCYADIPKLIADAVSRHPLMELVDGHALMDPVPKLYADADHPDATGHAQIAQRACRVLDGLPPKEPRAHELVRFERESEPVVADAQDQTPNVAPAPKKKRRKKREPKQDFVDVCLPLDFSGAAEEPEPVPAAKPEAKAEPAQPSAVQTVEEQAPASEERVEMAIDRTYETRYDGKPFTKDEKAAMELLAASGDLGALVMRDTIARGGARVRYAGDACVALDTSAKTTMLWAGDVEEAELVAEDVADRMVTTMCELVNAPVRAAQGWEGSAEAKDEWRLCVYRGTEPIAHENRLTVDPLDGSWAGKIRSLYSHPEFYTEEELAEICDAGRMWGAFDERCDFVGFIGLHADGAMGMLEILPKYRRRGYATELVATIADTLLARGWLPWGQIFCDNEASIELNEKLGMTVGADRLLCSFPKASGLQG
jgi:GNAT superfamily N-acetyltransferase